MAFKEFTFKSYNGTDDVQAWGYMPYQAPKAILLIVHGYGEHFRRYDYMIDRFVDAGYAVYGADRVGFGKTAEINDDWGYPGDKGFITYVHDQKTLHDIAVKDFPGIPFFMYGFSMGTSITRTYASMFPEDLSGILMSGVLCRWKNVDAVLAEGKFEAEIRAGQGCEPDDGTWAGRILVDTMVDHYPAGADPLSWLAYDPDLLHDNLTDPLNMGAHVPTKQLLWDLIDVYRFSISDACVDQISTTLPVYIFGGDNDPCCGYGEGAYAVANQLLDRGNKDVTVHLNPGYRHETHKEPAVKEAVVAGMIAFTDRIVAKG